MESEQNKPFPVFLAAMILLATLILVLFGISTVPPINAPYPSEDTTATLSKLDNPTVSIADPIRGPANAKVTVVVFGDYLCGPCEQMDKTLDQLSNDLPNDVRVVWKDFPNEGSHPGSTLAAIAGRCAFYQDAFWEYHRLLFANPNTLGSSNLPIIAGQLNLDTAAFTTCLDEMPARALVERSQEEGLRLGIDGTPYLFINNRRVSGAIDYTLLRQMVDAEIASAPAPKPADEPEAPAAPAASKPKVPATSR